MLLGLVACILVSQAVAQAAEPIELSRGEAPRHPQQPQLAIDGNGGIMLFMAFRTLSATCLQAMAARRSANRQNLQWPTRCPWVCDADHELRRRKKAFASPLLEVGKGRDGDLLAMTSLDGGKMWTGPVQVNDVDDSAREGLHAMAAGPKGEMCCVWLDLRKKNTEITASTSLDGGKTWGKNILAYTSPDGSVCECCHPSVTLDDRGRIYDQLHSSLGGN